MGFVLDLTFYFGAGSKVGLLVGRSTPRTDAQKYRGAQNCDKWGAQKKLLSISLIFFPDSRKTAQLLISVQLGLVFLVPIMAYYSITIDFVFITILVTLIFYFSLEFYVIVCFMSFSATLY